MKKLFAILNTIVIAAVIFWNYWSNTGKINGTTIGELSEKYDNLFTPADYAFAIWGLIFLSLIILGINQLRLAFFGGEHRETIIQIGPWLIFANLANAAWLWFWLNEQTGISVIVMLVILVSLIVIIVRLNMERWDAPLAVIAFVWWPICLYSGWIAVATIANFASWLAKSGWTGFFTEIQWTIIMVSVAALVNLYMIYSRNMREFAAVGAWAIIAIAARHWGEFVMIQWVCVFWAAVLLIAMGIHGYRNRDTNPFKQLTAEKS